MDVFAHMLVEVPDAHACPVAHVGRPVLADAQGVLGPSPA